MSSQRSQSRTKRLVREIALRCAGPLAACIIRAWFATLRYRCQAIQARRGRWSYNRPCIVAVWHNTLLMPVWFLGPGRLFALVSQSDDGEIIARMCAAMGLRPIRGSSSKGGSAAVREILRKAKRSSTFQLAVAVDGPRGPRFRCKEGVVFLASRMQVPIIPVGVFFERSWQFKSWDRFCIPVPFSRAAVYADKTIDIPPDLDADGIEQYCRVVEEAIDRARDQAQAITDSSEPKPSLAAADRARAA